MSQQLKRIGQDEQKIKQRHMQRLKKRRRQIAVRRFVSVFVLLAVIVASVVFLTPLFNIKNMEIRGNNRIKLEDLNAYLSDVPGENLFKVNNRYIKNKLKQISYINDVSVSKKHFPASITITISEQEPFGYFENGDNYDIIDRNCKVLESRTDEPSDMPKILFYNENGEESLKDEDLVKSLIVFFEITNRIELFPDITEVSVNELNEIEFEYNNRIKAICGSNLELEQKLRLFKVSVNNPNLSQNAHGTIDLRTLGKAMYTP